MCGMDELDSNVTAALVTIFAWTEEREVFLI
jgi:hypothetical protein